MDINISQSHHFFDCIVNARLFTIFLAGDKQEAYRLSESESEKVKTTLLKT